MPPGISHLLAGDLVYFSAVLGQLPEHVAIVTKTNVATNVVSIIAAADAKQGIIRDTFTPDIGSPYGGLVYIGALRPAP